MNQTPIQKQIEKAVTNGLGYDSRTIFKYEDYNLQTLIEENSCLLKEEYKNTKEGLQRHLRHLDRLINPSSIFKLGTKYIVLMMGLGAAIITSGHSYILPKISPPYDKDNPKDKFNLSIDKINYPEYKINERLFEKLKG